MKIIGIKNIRPSQVINTKIKNTPHAISIPTATFAISRINQWKLELRKLINSRKTGIILEKDVYILRIFDKTGNLYGI